MSQRKLVTDGWQRDSVTVPITSAIRMAVVLQSHHKPTHRRRFHAHQLPRPRAVVGYDHQVISRRAEAVDGQQWFAVRLILDAERQHDEQAPALHAGMLDRGDGVTDDASQLHEITYGSFLCSVIACG